MFRIRSSLVLGPLFGLLLAGCASKSSSIDQLTANQTNGYSSSRSIANQYASQTQHPQFGAIENRLRSGSEAERINACKQLGRIASENEGDLNSIDLLVDVMKSDDSMDVREAATDAIAQLQAPPMNRDIASMIPNQEQTTEQIGFLERWWR